MTQIKRYLCLQSGTLETCMEMQTSEISRYYKTKSGMHRLLCLQ